MAAGAQPIAAPPPAEITADPFLVRNVKVDVTAGSVTEARERSMAQGQVAAFRRLVERMSLRENWASIPTPDMKTIIDMVQEFSVSNERSSAVRYLADMSVRFDPVGIRNFLRAQNVPFAEMPSRPLVVVPLYQPTPGAAFELWQDANPWRDGWAASLPHDGLVPVVLPLGDLEDIAMVSVEQALATDRDALMKLATKYNATGAVVARATASGDMLTIGVTEVRGLAEPFEGQSAASIAATDDKARMDAYAMAAIESMRPIQDHWKQRNILRFGAGGKLTALIPITSLQDWQVIRARMARVPVVEKVDLEAISKTLVQTQVTFAGDEAQLQAAMQQAELELTKDGDYWLVRAPNLQPVQPVTSPTP
jgi:hypothetical protein